MLPCNGWRIFWSLFVLVLVLGLWSLQVLPSQASNISNKQPVPNTQHLLMSCPASKRQRPPCCSHCAVHPVAPLRAANLRHATSSNMQQTAACLKHAACKHIPVRWACVRCVPQWPRAVGDSIRRAAANRELMRAWASSKVAPRVLQAYDTHSLAAVCFIRTTMSQNMLLITWNALCVKAGCASRSMSSVAGGA